MADIRNKTRHVVDISRNRRQASMLLQEVARERTLSAEHTLENSQKLVQHCQDTYQKSNELRTSSGNGTSPPPANLTSRRTKSRRPK